LAVKFLDKVIDRNFYPTYEAKASNSRHRPVGLGIMGLQDFFFKMKIPFDSNEAIKWSAKIQEEIYYAALKTSCKLAKELGKHADFEKSHAANGLLQFDLAKPLSQLKDSMVEIFPNGTIIEDMARWNALKEDIKENGLRNSLLIAIAPTVTIAAITASQECIEPQISNIFKTETLSGEFIRTNRYLVEDLKEIGLWNKTIADKIIMAEGSIQNISEIPQSLKDLYKTVWEIKQRWLINHATVRSYFIDQSQSLNLFVENPKLETLSSMYMYLYEQDLKTSYYLRSKAATKINKSMTSDTQEVKNLENPETCESCT
jgi:ribonucleoside-diphosphate reductase alpha chain